MYGFETTRRIIAFSSILAGLAMGTAALGVGMAGGYLHLLGLLSAGLLLLALRVSWKAIERLQFSLFKYASVYMLCAMLLFVLQSV